MSPIAPHVRSQISLYVRNVKVRVGQIIIMLHCISAKLLFNIFSMSWRKASRVTCWVALVLRFKYVSSLTLIHTHSNNNNSNSYNSKSNSSKSNSNTTSQPVSTTRTPTHSVLLSKLQRQMLQESNNRAEQSKASEWQARQNIQRIQQIQSILTCHTERLYPMVLSSSAVFLRCHYRRRRC